MNTKDRAKALEQKLIAIAASMGGSAAIEYYEEGPLVISTDAFADIALKAAQSICGPNGAVAPLPSTGGEDLTGIVFGQGLYDE